MSLNPSAFPAFPQSPLSPRSRSSEKPLPENPEASRVKFDFHMHTLDDPFDQHVYHTIFELLDKAALLRYDALAITLHTSQFQSRTAEEYARERGILLIPGIEQDIEKTHVLLINFPKEASEGIRSFADLAKVKAELARTGAPESLVIAPHPFFPSEVALQEKFWDHKELFDAVEVSGFYHRYWNPNLKAMKAAESLGLPLVGNSDTHTLEQFGKTWSELECAKDTVSILRGIKAGKAVVKGRALAAGEMGIIGWKVIAQGYMKWINYKRTRGWQPVP
jgi:predicted metal-dependent phosphoesterase TrpH